MTNLAEINTLELSKLPHETDTTELWNWMRFMETNNEEELKMLATKGPELKKAVGVLMELSADERTRMLAESREKARRDEASRLRRARREGREEGREEGRVEGREEGREEGRVEGVQIGEMKIIELLKSGKSAEEIIREYGTE